MLLTISIILLALWSLGMVSGAQLGLWLHLLLLFSFLALILAVARPSRSAL